MVPGQQSGDLFQRPVRVDGVPRQVDGSPQRRLPGQQVPAPAHAGQLGEGVVVKGEQEVHRKSFYVVISNERKKVHRKVHRKVKRKVHRKVNRKVQRGA